MGRRATPAALREAKGNPGRRPIVHETSVEEAGASAPDWLHAEARKIWSRLAPDLQRMRLLARVDELTFGRYCTNLARWLAHMAVLDEHGETYTIKTESGEVIRPRPEALLADRVEARLVALEDRFGLNPSERQRIHAQRAAAQGHPGDLFDPSKAAPAAIEERAVKGPVGLLN